MYIQRFPSFPLLILRHKNIDKLEYGMGLRRGGILDYKMSPSLLVDGEIWPFHHLPVLMCGLSSARGHGTIIATLEMGSPS